MSSRFLSFFFFLETGSFSNLARVSILQSTMSNYFTEITAILEKPHLLNRLSFTINRYVFCPFVDLKEHLDLCIKNS